MKTVIYKRPTCINHGCEKPVMAASCTNKEAELTNNWRIHCGNCQKASYGGTNLAEGVTSFKTGRCSNIDGHMRMANGDKVGFKCCMNWDKLDKTFHTWKPSGITEIDHIDGNPSNNDPNNLQELCSFCHKVKGQLAGDYNRRR
jgi:hypothetical protein